MRWPPYHDLGSSFVVIMIVVGLKFVKPPLVGTTRGVQSRMRRNSSLEQVEVENSSQMKVFCPEYPSYQFDFVSTLVGFQ